MNLKYIRMILTILVLGTALLLPAQAGWLGGARSTKWSTTSDFNLGDKSEEDENNRVETNTDNPAIPSNKLQLGNLYGDRFNTMSKDADTWKWNIDFIFGKSGGGPGIANIDFTTNDMLHIELANVGAYSWWGAVLSKKLTGDFAVEIEILNWNKACEVLFGIFADHSLVSDYQYIGRSYTGGSLRLVSISRWNGVSDGEYIYTTISPKRYAIERNDDQVKSSYFYDDEWKELYVTTNSDADDVEVCCFIAGAKDTFVEVDFDDFKVIRGTFVGADMQAVGSWTSEKIPNYEYIKTIEVDYGDVDADQMFQVSIINNSDDAVLWSSPMISNQGYGYYTRDDFGDIPWDFNIRLDLYGDGEDSPTITGAEVTLTSYPDESIFNFSGSSSCWTWAIILLIIGIIIIIYVTRTRTGGRKSRKG